MFYNHPRHMLAAHIIDPNKMLAVNRWHMHSLGSAVMSGPRPTQAYKSCQVLRRLPLCSRLFEVDGRFVGCCPGCRSSIHHVGVAQAGVCPLLTLLLAVRRR